MALHHHRPPRAVPGPDERCLLADHERGRAALCADLEAGALAIAPSFNLVMVGEAQQAVATDAISAIGLAAQCRALRWKLHLYALVLDSVVSKAHPTPLELGQAHAMAIVLDHQHGFLDARHSDVHHRCASVPCIRDQFGQRDLVVMGSVPKRAYEIVLLKDRSRRCVHLIRPTHGQPTPFVDVVESVPLAMQGSIPCSRRPRLSVASNLTELRMDTANPHYVGASPSTGGSPVLNIDSQNSAYSGRRRCCNFDARSRSPRSLGTLNPSDSD